MSVPNLTSLLKQTDIDDHEEILRAANATLKQSKSNLDAQHVKVVALLNLDRYEDAVRAVETGGHELKQRARLEHAYALYKSGRPAEAADTARDGAERGLKHVEAQARYRIEDFVKAAELYRELGTELAGDVEADLRVNTGATDAQLEWAGQGTHVRAKKPTREDLEAFETAYNAACGSIARGELGQGEVLLKRAKDLCSAVEDMSEEEVQAELLPISIQQVYVLTRLGRVEEAQKLAETIDAKSLSDTSTRHIAKVNSLAASASPSNPFMAQRLLDNGLDSSMPNAPFNFQATVLKNDQFAIDLQSMKFGGTASWTMEKIAKEPSPTLNASTNTLSVVNASAHAKNHTGKEALKHILPLLEKRPNDVGLILTIVQLYVLTHNTASAVELLQSFFKRLEQSGSAAELDVRFAPGLVGGIVGLYASQGRRQGVRAELCKAATHWRRKPKDQLHAAGVVHLLETAGSALLESQDQEHLQLAKAIFQDLHDRDPQDRYAAAGLVAASTESGTSRDLPALTPIDRLIASIDTDALENAGIAQRASTVPQPTSRKRPAAEQNSKKPSKLRKSKMPKDYDPNKKPDPERWLPLKDRSTYRPKGKKGKARQALLSQGAVASESENSRPATPGVEVVKGKASGGGGGGAKKKKGKGGKK